MTRKTKVRLLSIAALGSMISSLGFAIAAAPELDTLYEMYISESNFSDEEPYEIKLRYLGKAAKVLNKSLLSAGLSGCCILAMKGQFLKTEAALVALLYSAVNGERPPLTRRQEKRIAGSRAEVILYEGYSAQYIPCNLKVVDRAVKRCNARLHQYYRVSLNRLIRELGGRPSTIGDYIGWECCSDELQDIWDGEEPYITVDLSEDFDIAGRNVIKVIFYPDPVKFE